MSKAEQTQDFLGITLTTDTGTYPIYHKDLLKLYFIEDIYSFSITGRLQLVDSGGLLEFGPFTGNEYFTITWGIEGETQKEIELYIYKVNYIEKSQGHFGTGGSLIDLFLTDKYFKLLNFKPHSYTFNNKKISNIIKEIGSLYLGIEEFGIYEQSKEKLPYYYTGMKTPGENIKWLLSRGSGLVSKTPGYLFYNTTQEKKSWNLCTLEYLLGSDTAKMCDPKGFEHIYLFESLNEHFINKILEYSSTKPDQTSLKKLMGGRKLGFNTDKKLFLDKKFSFEDALKKFTILGKKTLFQKSLKLEETEYISDVEGEFDEDILENLWYDNWIKQYCLQQTFSFIVKGHVERDIGTQIEVEWPSSDHRESINKQMMGRFLIKSITHQFSSNTSQFYLQKLVCIKNGYQDCDSNELIPSIKKNLG
jgi:hypothetical protein